jgi:hypothetical protein
MSTKMAIRTDVIGEGWVRYSLIGAGLVLIILAAALPHIAGGDEFALHFSEKRVAIYSSAFTFEAMLWGATLTIWTLLKSRATRYIERLADGVVFNKFIHDFEARVVLILLSLIVTFVIFVADTSLKSATDPNMLLVFGWIFVFIWTNTLICDSLLTARMVLN